MSNILQIDLISNYEYTKMLKKNFVEQLQSLFQWTQNFLEKDYLRDPTT